MGWYLRKSLNLGPLRLNLSKSGLGVSAGIKGLRVGAGPRGKYLHAGREGLYYRTSLDGPTEPQASKADHQVADAELDGPVKDPTEEQRLAAARWARINGRAQSLRDSGSNDVGRSFLSGFLGGIFGGLLRGR